MIEEADLTRTGLPPGTGPTSGANHAADKTVKTRGKSPTAIALARLRKDKVRARVTRPYVTQPVSPRRIVKVVALGPASAAAAIRRRVRGIESCRSARATTAATAALTASTAPPSPALS